MTVHNSDGIEKEKIKSLENLNVNSIIQEHNDFASSIRTKILLRFLLKLLRCS